MSSSRAPGSPSLPTRRNNKEQQAATRPAPPPPSTTYRTYGAALYSLSVPDNRREYPSGPAVVLAPDGSAGTFGGRQGYTHCAMVGAVPAQGRTLRQATELLVSGLMRQQGNHLQQQGDYVAGMPTRHPRARTGSRIAWQPSSRHRRPLTRRASACRASRSSARRRRTNRCSSSPSGTSRSRGRPVHKGGIRRGASQPSSYQ